MVSLAPFALALLSEGAPAPHADLQLTASANHVYGDAQCVMDTRTRRSDPYLLAPLPGNYWLKVELRGGEEEVVLLEMPPSCVAPEVKPHRSETSAHLPAAGVA